MALTLEVFANTGHQYFSIPLIDALPKAQAQKVSPDLLEKLVLSNRGPFEPLCQEMPWLRYQLDLVDGKPMLRLAIETNLGLSTRGFLFDVEEVDEMPETDY